MGEFNFAEELKKMPQTPGVYLMHDAHDDVIYVGKAVNLKRRVSSYFRKSTKRTTKIESMVSKIRRFEYILTDSELEALILECNLIKEYRPKYNTMLMDDKTYPYVMITVSEDYPRIVLARRMKKDNNKYFGPFTSSAAVKDTIDLLQKMYQIRSCNKAIVSDGTYTADGEYKNIPKINGRPCLYYHMGQCQAPCQGYISQEEYHENVRQMLHFLGGNFEPVIQMLTDKMYAASEKMDFEKAASYRDLLNSVKQIDQKQKITSSEMDDKDVIAFARDKDEAVVQVFFVRHGRLIGREHFYVSGVANDTESQVLTAFVKQYYASSPFVPSTLMLQYPLDDREVILEWLSGRKGHKVREVVPQRGQKERLVELAAENARNVLTKDREKIRLEEARTTGAVRDLAEMLGLPAGIRRMEAFDISNISGVETVGSMIVYENGKPKRNAYRKFKIRTVKGQDDYRCMEEVLTRRFQHGLEETVSGEEGKFSDFPDVLMMDGGKGQVNVALKVLNQLHLKIPVCGMVKDDHHRTRGLYYQQVELPIDTHSEMFKLITRMQDEAHRFAIEYHRQLRSKTQVRSVLDEIPGIGPARRKALMKYFGSIEKIREADEEELMKAESMNAGSARAVYAYFH